MKRFRWACGLALACALVVGLVAGARGDTDGRAQVVASMREELKRSMTRLRLRDYEKPYFIAYTVRDYDKHQLMAKFGALHNDSRDRTRRAYVEVRVGDYRFDNSTNASDDMLFGLDDLTSYEPSTSAPLDDDDGAALRGTLWLLTDAKYKHALAAYAKKRGRRATTLSDDEALESFSREPAARAMEPRLRLEFDAKTLGERARMASERFKHYPELIDGTIDLSGEHLTRYLVTSEGTELVSERVIYALIVSAATRAPDGALLEHEKAFYAEQPDGLPDQARLLDTVDQLSAELLALRQAKVIDPYTGPAILMHEAAGVFFHEAVGHRLEGERQNDEKEGRTFKGQLGRRILPEFISVLDDPTLRQAAGMTLNGFYAYDDEGVAARPVTLVSAGVLRDYLKSRTPITGSPRSNGHARAEVVGDPIGRMANLIVRSTRQVPLDELKRQLLDEVRRQGKPFGLIIRDVSAGATNTSNFGFQAFKGQPRLVYRVDATTGEETLVRGVELVGTPLTAISRIIATSDTEGVFNGYCGAESGYVPVSTVAPAMLLSEIELQRAQRSLERPPLLPPPWQEPAAPRSAAGH